MTVEISYFSGFATGGRPVAGHPQTSESVAITGAATASGATPDATEVVRITGTEPFRYEYKRLNGVAVSATATSHYVSSGQEVWLAAKPQHTFSLRTP